MCNTTREGMAETEHCSRMTLYTRLLPFFVHPPSPDLVWRALPPVCSHPSCTPWAYGADGFWFHRNRIVLFQRDVTHRQTLWWSHHLSESRRSIEGAIQPLASRVNTDALCGFVSDWKQSITTSLITAFGLLPHQRCLTHVVRAAKRFLPKTSPFLGTRRLRDLAAALHHIRTREDQHAWESAMTRWGYVFGDMLFDRTVPPLHTTTRKWWYTHGNVRRAWRLVTRDHHALFVHILHPTIPSTNNSLEGINRSHASSLGIHRGLTIAYQVSLVYWRCAFSRANTRNDLRRLWDMWKKIK